MRTQKDKSAGAIVVNKQNQFLLLFQNQNEFWEFPKGEQEKGETEKQALCRELFEETGIKKFQYLPGFKQKSHYRFQLKGVLHQKEVIFYLIRTEDKVHLSDEHISYRWIPYSGAIKLLKHKNLRDLLKSAQQFLKLSAK
ncbi:MAG: NUDIX domain-containing protein [Patescibacteria group bacterium]